MGGPPFRPENAVPDPWDVLHQGADREELDSPARFTLDRAAVLMRVRSLHGVQRQRRRAPEPPVPGGVAPPASAPKPFARPQPSAAPPPLVPPSQTSGYVAPGPPPPEYAPRPRSRTSPPHQGFAPEQGTLPEPVEVHPTGRHAAPPLPVVPPVPPRPSPSLEERARASANRTRTLMRPYAHTRGRTRPDYELALETLVSTSLRGRRYEGTVSVQQRRICALCTEPRSIAEIAAYLHLPLNVVKVLVSDMDDAELVILHQPGLSFGDRSSREFMQRVLEGLRAL